MMLLLATCIANAQEESQDTISIKENLLIMSDSVVAPTKVPQKNYWKPNASKAMWYSVLCPGLGQIYNRSYWKVPIIYGGGAVFSYLIAWQGRMYKEYSTAYYDFMDADPKTNSYESIFRNINGTDEWKAKTLQQKRNYYRRYRDMCVFGIGILYVLNIMDAFVDGHLYDFNVSEDLSLRIEPVVKTPLLQTYDPKIDTPSLMGVQCSLRF